MTFITPVLLLAAPLLACVPLGGNDGDRGLVPAAGTVDYVLTSVQAEADTATVDARIRDAFPGYRLSTEAEIDDRFPLLDGTTVSMFVPEFGTGAVWWVKRADLTGDGVEDVLTVATSIDDPSVDRLVVLHGDGSASSIGGLGGWGFSHGEDEIGPYVVTIYWEKGADLYRWDGEGFPLWVDPDGCC
jgi:hypothetical protein